MTKKDLSARVNQLLGLNDPVDFSPMKSADLQRLIHALENKQVDRRAPLDISVKTERKPLLERRPVRDLLREVLSRA